MVLVFILVLILVSVSVSVLVSVLISVLDLDLVLVLVVVSGLVLVSFVLMQASKLCAVLLEAVHEAEAQRDRVLSDVAAHRRHSCTAEHALSLLAEMKTAEERAEGPGCVELEKQVMGWDGMGWDGMGVVLRM